MNQVISVALGGAFGAVFRFLISSGVYQWLGRGFPYGTLAVNVIGSLLIGVMTETLILQRVALSMEYRSAILVGFFGSLTTFSTFSLDTFYFIEQGLFIKAGLNVLVNVAVCLVAVWIGLSLGKALFSTSLGSLAWKGWTIPYGLLLINGLIALLIGTIGTLLLSKSALSMEYSVTIMLIIVGVFITLSSLYLLYSFFESGQTFETHLKSITVAIISHLTLCSLSLWLGFWAGRQL